MSIKELGRAVLDGAGLFVILAAIWFILIVINTIIEQAKAGVLI